MSFTKENPFSHGGFNSNPNQPFSGHGQGFNANNIIQNFGFNDSTSSQLQGLLGNCSYHPQHYYSVFESVNKLVYTYPQLKPDILRFKDSNGVKSLIQLQGTIHINFHGDKMGVSINIMFPQKYPHQAPHIRIINTHPQSTQASPHYQVFESVNYPNSYVISNMLTTIENWNSNSNIVDIIREAEVLMGKKFPFKKVKPGHQKKSIHSSQVGTKNRDNNQSNLGFNNNQGFNSLGYNNNQGSNDSSWDWNSYNNNNNSNNNNNNNNVWNNYNNNNTGWNNPDNNWKGANSNTNQGFNNNNNNNNNNWNNNYNNNNNNSKSNNNPNQNNNSWNQPKVNKLSPEQIQAQNKLDDYITRCTNFAGQSKKMIDKLVIQRQKDYKQIQNIEPLVMNIRTQKLILQQRIQSMTKFIKQNESIQQIDLAKMFTPKDQKSNQLLELVCINRAANDTLDQIERKFEEKRITLQQLLKLTRKIEEERFMSKIMIKKKLEQN